DRRADDGRYQPRQPERAGARRGTARRATDVCGHADDHGRRRVLGRLGRFARRRRHLARMSVIEQPAPYEQRRAVYFSTLGETEAPGWPLNSTSQALESSRIVKSGAGFLFGFGGFNNKASAQFILAFDVEKIPAVGAVPVFWMTV